MSKIFKRIACALRWNFRWKVFANGWSERLWSTWGDTKSLFDALFTIALMPFVLPIQFVRIVALPITLLAEAIFFPLCHPAKFDELMERLKDE